jgi:hypothetical protein
LKKDKNEFFNKLKNIQEFESTTGPLLNRLNQLLRKYLIKKWMDDLKPIARGYKLLYLFKLAYMFKGIAKNRYIREIIRKWRFTTFVKVIAKRKLELMYKNLHVSYLQMANEVFGDEETTTNASVVKEFERFGTDVGMWGNEDPNNPTETSYVKSINKKYIFETLDGENNKLFDEFNSDFEKKKVVVSQIITEDSKIVGGGKNSSSNMEGGEMESGSESSRRRRNREKKDESKGEVESKDVKVESEGNGKRSYRRKKEEKKDEDDEKKLSHRNMRKSHV